MKTIAILNGPNLNFLGKRQPEIYGLKSLENLRIMLEKKAKQLDCQIIFEASNHEGTLIDHMQKWDTQNIQGLILNAGGLAHTSVSLRDAISSISYPVIEVHISNIHARELFRQTSLLTAVCKGTITGLGLQGYSLALEYFCSSSIDSESAVISAEL